MLGDFVLESVVLYGYLLLSDLFLEFSPDFAMDVFSLFVEADFWLLLYLILPNLSIQALH